MRLPLIVFAAFAVLPLPPAGAEMPSAGRYELQPADNGFLRLDRDSGATSFCAATADGYACRPVAEGGQPIAGDVAGQLEKRIAALEAQIAMSDAPPAAGLPPIPALPNDDATPGKESRRDDLDGPTDKQMDKMAGFVERAIKRLKKMAEEMQKDDAPKGERL